MADPGRDDTVWMDAAAWKDVSAWEGVRPGIGGPVPVAVGGDVAPGTLLAAYRLGVFCQPTQDAEQAWLNREIYEPDVTSGAIPVLPGPNGADPYEVLWWAPAQRALLPVDGFRLGRHGAKYHRRYPELTSTVDSAFDEVVERCRKDREPVWLTDPLVAGLRKLHDAGAVHSLEIRRDGALVAGLFGYALPRVFVVDSAFQSEDQGLKALYLDLTLRSRAAGIEFIDLQIDAEHKRRMGARIFDREFYLGLLGDVRGTFAAEPRTLSQNLIEYLANEANAT
ncbi:leucyl/phenylalanyl-tRNA--protein transferase [Streptomyces sp. NBC_01092]|uniref:leucyl/phenylalanyl-tRNA--protein transferase n=1 Tax=Streptomyces sp. NBC_01092 TaxID=2903748 RepID=UPI00386D04EB|nr:hypothetical protein OG254_09875 [Streptomyces sp. NBC_01092]